MIWFDDDDNDGSIVGDLVGMILGWFDGVLLVILGSNDRSSDSDEVCIWLVLRWYDESKTRSHTLILMMMMMITDLMSVI